jgi:hypothetical protein
MNIETREVGDNPAPFAMVTPCEFTVFAVAGRNLEKVRSDAIFYRVAKISDNVYQAAQGKDGLINQFRFKDGLLDSNIVYIDPTQPGEDPYPMKYTYGMPSLEDQQIFEALLGQRRSLFDSLFNQ